ncbi:MAG: hypothetical protein OEX07_01645 [Gammaproteobacteria bacterium]|nr:hypothetical protein [Gammaproteobacteria bacterium]
MKLNVIKTAIIFVTFGLFTQGACADDFSKNNANDISINWADSFRLEAERKYYDAAKAIEIYTKSSPVNEFAIIRHGWLNYLMGNHNDSISDYQLALTINPNSLDSRLGLILPLLAQARWREATLHANKVLAVAPWQYYAHVRLMIAEEAQLQWNTLEKHASAVAERYPSDATVQVYLARAFASQAKKEAAISVYKKVLQMVPGHIEATRYLATAGK